MNKIKIINPNNSNDFFEIPWEWLPEGTQGPILNDLEASAERSKINAYLARVRAGSVPAATLDIDVRLSQKELWPLFRLIDLPKINIYYFEKYRNKFITREFYGPKANPGIYRIPLDNNTNNIIYNKFKIEFAGYGDVGK